MRFRADASYLITGGLGGLGILFAKEILQQTTKARIILTGRSALTAQKQAIEALQESERNLQLLNKRFSLAAEAMASVSVVSV